ncbi:MAG: amidohydrolase family protein, partial [Chitinophagaceae bacterium]
AGDICNNALTLPQKAEGRMRYHNFVEASGFVPAVAEERFRRSVALFNQYEEYCPGANSIVPHAPYSVSAALWEQIIRFPGNRLLTIHNQESLSENELFMQGGGEFLRLYEMLGMDISFFRPSGKSSLQTYLPGFLPEQSLLLVHNVYTTREDVRFARETGIDTWWCLCPNANLYITGHLPDMAMLVQEKQRMVLGTDSLASNHQLSILAEMQAIRRHIPSVTDDQLFGWATLNGARALQLDAALGSFDRGKQPGVVLSSTDLASAQRLL